MRKTTKVQADWAERIINLRHRRKLSQSALGKLLDSSAMAVSRWERAVQEPPANIYIQLGNITGDPECWYFWERAGLQSGDLMRVLPSIRSRLRRDRLPDFEIVHAGARASKTPSKKTQLVAIPVLPVVAATHDGKAIPSSCLSRHAPSPCSPPPRIGVPIQPRPAAFECAAAR